MALRAHALMVRGLGNRANADDGEKKRHVSPTQSSSTPIRKVVRFPSGRLGQNGIDNGATMIVNSSGNPVDPKTQQWLEIARSMYLF